MLLKDIQARVIEILKHRISESAAPSVKVVRNTHYFDPRGNWRVLAYLKVNAAEAHALCFPDKEVPKGVVESVAFLKRSISPWQAQYAEYQHVAQLMSTYTKQWIRGSRFLIDTIDELEEIDGDRTRDTKFVLQDNRSHIDVQFQIPEIPTDMFGFPPHESLGLPESISGLGSRLHLGLDWSRDGWFKRNNAEKFVLKDTSWETEKNRTAPFIEGIGETWYVFSPNLARDGTHAAARIWLAETGFEVHLRLGPHVYQHQTLGFDLDHAFKVLEDWCHATTRDSGHRAFKAHLSASPLLGKQSYTRNTPPELPPINQFA